MVAVQAAAHLPASYRPAEYFMPMYDEGALMAPASSIGPLYPGCGLGGFFLVYPGFGSVSCELVAADDKNTIRACDDHVKVLTILARVDGCFRGESGAPEGALDVGKAWRVSAVVRRVHRWIPFKVNIKGSAEVDRVTKRLASGRIISVKGMKAHITVGIGRSLLVDK